MLMSMSLRWGMWFAGGSLCIATLVGCGDEGEGGDAEQGTTTMSTDTTGGPSTQGDTTTSPGTTSAGTTTGEPGTGTGSGSTGTGVDTGSESGSDSTGAGVACDDLPAGPFTAEEAFADFSFDGSEDLAFDGQGHMVAKQGTSVVMVTADGTPTTLAVDLPNAYGLRYRTNGDLLVAAFQQAQILQVSPSGDVSTFATGVGGVNGLYPDFDDNVWFTNFNIVGRIDAGGDTQTVVSGAESNAANGVVFDPDRGLLFFTNYSAGTIRRAVIDAKGAAEASEIIGTIDGSPDGLTLDACGNLYAVDQGGNMIYRLWLDETGAAIGEPEALLDAPTPFNIANAQFGVGEGWDEETLYAAGVPGTVYAISVGVTGAPYPTPG
jgi:hypothetical protein